MIGYPKDTFELAEKRCAACVGRLHAVRDALEARHGLAGEIHPGTGVAGIPAAMGQAGDHPRASRRMSAKPFGRRPVCAP
jgi:hypothetical protein